VDEEDADTDHRVLLLAEMQASITNVLGALLLLRPLRPQALSLDRQHLA
jgi:hypothetical protein